MDGEDETNDPASKETIVVSIQNPTDEDTESSEPESAEGTPPAYGKGK